MSSCKDGCKVPVDGTVVLGEGSVNEASITGESLPLQRRKVQSICRYNT